jgi:hypothetical protein
VALLNVDRVREKWVAREIVIIQLLSK